jgi:hypothetical protein
MNPPATLTVILKNEDSMYPNKYYIKLQPEIVNTDVKKGTITIEEEKEQ